VKYLVEKASRLSTYDPFALLALAEIGLGSTCLLHTTAVRRRLMLVEVGDAKLKQTDTVSLAAFASLRRYSLERIARRRREGGEDMERD
jgi:hypothetical protein